MNEKTQVRPSQRCSCRALISPTVGHFHNPFRLAYSWDRYRRIWVQLRDADGVPTSWCFGRQPLQLNTSDHSRTFSPQYRFWIARLDRISLYSSKWGWVMYSFEQFVWYSRSLILALPQQLRGSVLAYHPFIRLLNRNCLVWFFPLPTKRLRFALKSINFEKRVEVGEFQFVDLEGVESEEVALPPFSSLAFNLLGVFSVAYTPPT